MSSQSLQLQHPLHWASKKTKQNKKNPTLDSLKFISALTTLQQPNILSDVIINWYADFRFYDYLRVLAVLC